jgi:hypothetical protein
MAQTVWLKSSLLLLCLLDLFVATLCLLLRDYANPTQRDMSDVSAASLFEGREARVGDNIIDLVLLALTRLLMAGGFLAMLCVRGLVWEVLVEYPTVTSAAAGSRRIWVCERDRGSAKHRSSAHLDGESAIS